MRWWRRERKHRCTLPAQSDEFERVGKIFTCPECGQEWREVWISDIEEYTIMTFADIGGWSWWRVEPDGAVVSP